MASREAVRALRSILRNSSRTRAAVQHRRGLCNECFLKEHGRGMQAVRRQRLSSPGHPLQGMRVGRRSMATLAELRRKEYNQHGPMAEYDARVHSGRLRDDEHQRTLVQALQDLHDTLMGYKPSKVVHPTIESLQPKKKSFFSSMFGGGASGPLEM